MFLASIIWIKIIYNLNIYLVSFVTTYGSCSALVGGLTLRALAFGQGFFCCFGQGFFCLYPKPFSSKVSIYGRFKVYKRYLKDKGIQKVPKGPRYQKGTYRAKLSKRYLKVQSIRKVPKGPGYPKGTYGSKVSKMYLKVPGIQKIPTRPRYPKGT